MPRWFDYNMAIVRGLPASFTSALVLHPPPEPIDMCKAASQHEEYTRLIKKLLGDDGQIIEITADEACPDCVFVEVHVSHFRMLHCL